MPKNKNAMTRYKILDELLSDRYHDYTLDDLTNIVNDRLAVLDIEPIVRRTIEKDIQYLEYDSDFLVEIERYTSKGVDSFDKETQRTVAKRCLRYADPTFSIFKKAMSDDERYLLRELLTLVGQFDGLPELSTLEDLRARLQLSESKQIIDLSKNPLSNSNLFAQLFSAISHKQVIKIQYYRFDNINNHHDTIVHPYLLKEYNRRWYLICASEKDDKLLTFALDRIISIETLPAHTYKEYDDNLQERYEDIVGVTLYENKPLEHIVFWVSDESKHYVMTKPIHESQRNHTQERATELRKTYPMLINGAFFSVDCIVNYELIRELMSFGKDLLVLEPLSIKNEIIKKISTNLEEYTNLRT